MALAVRSGDLPPPLPVSNITRLVPNVAAQRDQDVADFWAEFEPGVFSRTLVANEVLFREGERKTHVYRVESGVVCVYQPRWNGHRADIEFAFPGDLLGLGYLDAHAFTARATVETRVTCLPLSAVHSLVEHDPKAREKLADAIERDLETVRDDLVKAGHRQPIARVAALLVALSHGSKLEGMDPTIVSDSMKCGYVAGQLSMSIDFLASILVELQKSGLIETCPQGLRLKDLEALERLADGRCAFEPGDDEPAVEEIRYTA
jgi:CRP/FNR family transcriptional regulator